MGLVALPRTSEVLQYSCQSVSLESRSLKRGFYCPSDCSRRCLQSHMKELPLTFTTLSSSVSRKFKDREHTTGPSWLTAAVENKVITETAKAAVTPATVKKLREETGAGMMDCKKALETNDGDFEKAREFLRKKGLASAEKKSSRITAEGRIGSYIHDNRIGVLIEVNCETDFVARGEIFQQLVDDLAMQLVACQQVRFVSVESIPEKFVKEEKEIEMQKEDLLKKPEAIRGKIVEGRITKMLAELALLEQSYIKDDSILIKDLLKQTVASVGENIKVRRFERFILGEGLEKRSQDFAAEVAAQTKAS